MTEKNWNLDWMPQCNTVDDVRVWFEYAQRPEADLPAPALVAGSIQTLLDAVDRARAALRNTRSCPTCMVGGMRETVGLVCQTCGTDYGQSG